MSDARCNNVQNPRLDLAISTKTGSNPSKLGALDLLLPLPQVMHPHGRSFAEYRNPKIVNFIWRLTKGWNLRNPAVKFLALEIFQAFAKTVVDPRNCSRPLPRNGASWRGVLQCDHISGTNADLMLDVTRKPMVPAVLSVVVASKALSASDFVGIDEAQAVLQSQRCKLSKVTLVTLELELLATIQYNIPPSPLNEAHELLSIVKCNLAEQDRYRPNINIFQSCDTEKDAGYVETDFLSHIEKLIDPMLSLSCLAAINFTDATGYNGGLLSRTCAALAAASIVVDDDRHGVMTALADITHIPYQQIAAFADMLVQTAVPAAARTSAYSVPTAPTLKSVDNGFV